jgi:hypothetical protein
MHATPIRSAQSLGILNDTTPSRWRSRLRSILSSHWYRKTEEPKHDGLYRLDGRLLADVGLYRERRIHNPEDRADQQRESPVPVASLAIWMPLI